MFIGGTIRLLTHGRMSQEAGQRISGSARLDPQVAIISGSTRGIGKACAVALAKQARRLEEKCGMLWLLKVIAGRFFS